MEKLKKKNLRVINVLNNRKDCVIKYEELYYYCKYKKDRIETCDACEKIFKGNCGAGIEIGKEIISFCSLHTDHSIELIKPTEKELLYYKITNLILELKN